MDSGNNINWDMTYDLSVNGILNPVAAYSPSSVTVTALDLYGNTATGYVGTVHFISTDPQAVLPGNSTLVNGTRTFGGGVTLKTVGTQSVTATDTLIGSITGSQTGIQVNAIPANSSVFTDGWVPQDQNYIYDPWVDGSLENQAKGCLIYAEPDFINLTGLMPGFNGGN